MTPSSGARRIHPLALVAAIVGVMVALVFFAPQPVDEPAQYGTSYSFGPDGAGIAYELAHKIGWSVARRDAPLDTITAPTTVQVLITTQFSPTKVEAGWLLRSVRAGGGLLLAGDIGPLDDSLHFETDWDADDDSLVPTPVDKLCLEPGATSKMAQSLADIEGPHAVPIKWTAPPPASLQTLGRFASIKPRTTSIVGFQLGKGRVVIVAAGNLLHNSILKHCQWGVDADYATALGYLQAADSGTPPRNTLAFDEFHHGYGTQPGAFRAAGLFIARTSWGKIAVQLAVAGILLMLAFGPRPIPPREPERIPRRSPLEHVDALARAYQQVKGSRTVALRLVGGLRRRVRGGRLWRSLSDEQFLAQVAASYPARQADASLVSQALVSTIQPGELPPVGDALHRIENDLTTSSSSIH